MAYVATLSLLRDALRVKNYSLKMRKFGGGNLANVAPSTRAKPVICVRDALSV